MSIATSTAKVQYTLSSAVQALPVTFYFLENAHIKAVRARTGVVDYTMILGTDYTLAGAGDEDGGTLTTIATNLQAGDKITIKRNVAITQEVNYVYNDKFPAEVHERALDKLTMVTQQLKEVTDRALQFPESEVAGTGNFLPAASLRAAKILGFDATGNAIELLDPISAVFATGDVIQTNSITALKAVSVTALTNGYLAFVAGYSLPNDRLGGMFAYDSASSETENIGTIVAPNSGTGRWKRIYSGALNLKWFGAKGDGVTDDSTAVQAALDFVGIAGGKVFVPAGRYLLNTAILLPVTDKQVSIEGENERASVFVSGITSVTATAMFKGIGLIGNRCYVRLQNLALEGNSAANVHGIYLIYGTPFSDFRNILITGFVDGIRLAKNYRCTLDNVQSILNTNGATIGLDLAGAGATCNAINVLGGRFDSNTGKGLYFYGCRNVVVNGSDVENCGVDGLRADYVFGLSVHALYSEGSTNAHFVGGAHYNITNSWGVVLDGLNVSNWYAGNTLISIADSSGVSINGFVCEKGIGATSTVAGTAITISASQGVVLNGGYIRNIANGVVITANGRVQMNLPAFDYVTVPLTMPDEAFSVAIWHGAYAANIASSTFGAAAVILAFKQEGTVFTQNYTI